MTKKWPQQTPNHRHPLQIENDRLRAALTPFADAVLKENVRLRACMERSKNSVGGVLCHFEEDGNAIGQAMMEGIYMDLDETLAGSISARRRWLK